MKRPSSMFTGCGTALVTPFGTDGFLDERALRSSVRRQIEAGVDFLSPCGTTGESPTLSHAEHLRVVEITVEEADGRIPVLAGAGGYDTQHVKQLAKDLGERGADGLLSVTPYYNKPTQKGLIQHYEAIALRTELPIMIYSVQGRTGVNVEPATLERLASVPNIVGVKEASGSVAQMAAILARVPDSFLVLSGDDALTLPLISIGGRGVISVVSNVIPYEWRSMTRLALDGHFDKARPFARRFQPLVEAMFLETNPGPVKAALASLGLIEPIWRLPMVPPQDAFQQKIEAVLQSLQLSAGVRQ